MAPSAYQMSSQMVTPTLAPAMVKSWARVAFAEVAALVEDAVVGQVLLVVDAGDARHRAMTAAAL